MDQFEKEMDPVCGMSVDQNSAAGSYEYKGKAYYFCSTHCLHRFREAPERFLNQAAEPMQPVDIQRAPPKANTAATLSNPIANSTIRVSDKTPAKTEYTCPMHPEVVRDAPGSCPICGMALEPRTVSLEEEENP